MAVLTNRMRSLSWLLEKAPRILPPTCLTLPVLHCLDTYHTVWHLPQGCLIFSQCPCTYLRDAWYSASVPVPTTGMSDIQPVSLYLPQGCLIFSQCPCTYHKDAWYSASVPVPTTGMSDIQPVSLYLLQGCLIFSHWVSLYLPQGCLIFSQCPCTYHRDVWYSASVPVPTTRMSDIQPVSLYYMTLMTVVKLKVIN